jgi:hypothetical protein
MNTPPRELVIGSVWKRKRGRPQLPPEILVRNIYRPDRAVLVRHQDGQRTLRWSDLKRDYKLRRQ